MISGVEYVSSQLLHRRAHLRYFSRRPQKQRCFRNGDRVPGETRSRRKPISPSRISAHCARCPPCPDRICVSLQSLPLLLLLGSPSTRCIRVAFRCSECETAGEKLARVVIENIATVCVCVRHFFVAVWWCEFVRSTRRSGTDSLHSCCTRAMLQGWQPKFVIHAAGLGRGEPLLRKECRVVRFGSAEMKKSFALRV